MKQFLALSLMLWGALASAALPMEVKSLNNSTWESTVRLEAPAGQLTKSGDQKMMIETGNDNLLINGGFEHQTVTTGWTVAANTTANPEPTNIKFGAQGLYVINTGGTLTQRISQEINPTTDRVGNWVASAWVSAVAVGDVTVCRTAATVEVACKTVTVGTGWQQVNLPFTAPASGAFGITFKADTGAQYYIDKTYVGLNRDQTVGAAFQDSDWVDGGAITLTSTGGGVVKGTTSRDKVWYRRNGPNLDLRIEYAQSATGTAGSGDYLFGIPTASGCTIDSSKIAFYTAAGTNGANTLTGFSLPSITSGVGTGGVVVPYDATRVRFASSSTSSSANFRFIGNTTSWFNTADAGLAYTSSFTVPCTGWGPTTAIGPAQWNHDWIDGGAITLTAATTNPTKGTTTRDKFWYKRSGSNLLVRLEYAQSATGTAGSGDYYINIPAVTGCTIDSTRASFYTGSVANGSSNLGSAGGGYTTTQWLGYISAFDATRVRVMLQAESATGQVIMSSANFPVSLAGTAWSASFSVPCTGWVENQGAGAVGVSSIYDPTGTKRPRKSYASFDTSCTTGTCAVNAGTGDMTIAFFSTGVYTATVTPAMSSTMVCTANSSQFSTTQSGTTTNAAVTYNTRVQAGSNANVTAMAISCDGFW